MITNNNTTMPSTTAATTNMEITPHRRPFQRLHANSTTKTKQLGKNHTTEDGAADKPSIFKHHHSNVLVDQREEDEPLLLEEASSGTSMLDIYSERSSSVTEEEEQQQSIFRPQSFVDDDDELEGLWTLKRANPVLEEGDDEDEDDDYKSPSKRQCATAALDWDDAIATDAPFRLTVSESGSFLLS